MNVKELIALLENTQKRLWWEYTSLMNVVASY